MTEQQTTWGETPDALAITKDAIAYAIDWWANIDRHTARCGPLARHSDIAADVCGLTGLVGRLAFRAEFDRIKAERSARCDETMHFD